MQKFHSGHMWREHKSESNVIPLIDIAFLLIIFLMVVTEFASMDKVEKMTLPSALEVKPEQPKADRVIISVDSEKTIWISGRRKTLREVEDVLRQERFNRSKDMSKTTEQPILIQGDRDVPWEVVQDVMEIAAKLKFRNISFGAKKEIP
jgi:biopolymer transport protein ExbD